jgi:hypothetical protein
MTVAGAASLHGVRVRSGNPFPGLRPFEQHEAALFFGRDEQCDDLLSRLARRRLVAVVGMSGSGKSSLVRAGLLPALDRGYLPSAGSAWHIAVFRPGSDPVGNLARGLAARRMPAGGTADDDAGEIRASLERSSLGLATIAQTLVGDGGDSLLVVADQFEEIFRFGRIAGSGAHEQAAACVDLLINASQQDAVPVYVVITMRSDYLGDCARFTGLPEALNDSQFLVPRMTRAQLRAAIECPCAVGGARIEPRLVQRLLYEVEEMSAGQSAGPGGFRRRDEQDQLPVLQHALMRVWEVSHQAREVGQAIDLPHYERPPVETLQHALDRHAEEVYSALPSDRHRDVARLVFQQLTDRDAENREVRRPTPIAELTAVALRRPADAVTPADSAIVNAVIAAFAAEGRAFVVVNAQQDVDISHESFIRKWERLRKWVDEENRSRRIYSRLADVASSWERGEASLYRGPELAEAKRWWQREQPTREWAERYAPGFEIARRFLDKSLRWRRLRRGLLFGNAALLLVGAVTIAILMAVSRNQARKAEAAALEARNATAAAKQELTEANRLRTEALDAQRRGESARADALARQAQQVEQQASARPVLTPSELTELERLRKQELVWKDTETRLRKQLDAANASKTSDVAAAPPPRGDLSGGDRAELDRLRKAEADWDKTRTQLQQQASASADQATKAQQSEAALRKSNEDLQSRLSAVSGGANPGDIYMVEAVLLRYQRAYQRLDAAAVAALVPSIAGSGLDASFAQLRSYGMEIVDPQISIAGDTATVKCVRRMSPQPKIGSRQNPREVPTVMTLKRTGATWVIESVQ